MSSVLHIGHWFRGITGIGIGNNPLLVLVTLVVAICAKRVGGSHARQLRIAAIRGGMHGFCCGQRVVPVGILICHLSHFQFRNIILVVEDVRLRACVIAIAAIV